MVTSRLTSRWRTTIPRNVRQGLQLQEGDLLRFELMDGYAVLRKQQPAYGANEDAFPVFEEWAGEADQRAYREL